MSRIFVPHVITDDSALGGRVIDKSLRFRSSNSANLQRSISTTGDRRTYTISFWIKRSKLGEQAYLDHYEDDANRSMHMFDASNKARLFSRMSNSTHENVYSNTLFRDTNSWYHIVWEVDTRELTAADRIKLWVNGVQDTFSSSSFPSLNGYAQVNSTNAGIRLGCNNDSGGLEAFLDGYIAEWHFLDGTAFDCTHFGYFDSQTGIWRPKRFDKSVIPNRSTRAFSGSGWTVSGGSGFSGSKPITNAYNGSIGTSNSDVANNSAGGATLTWDTSAYNLTGNLRIFCWSDGGEYDIYVNGNSGNTTKVGDTPSGSGNAAWIDCGTFDHIKEIQFSGTTYNTDTGLGSSGVYIAGFMVNGTLLRDDMPEHGTNGFNLDFSDNTNTTTLGIDKSPNGNDFTPEDVATSDCLKDTPTNAFATLNANVYADAKFKEGNLYFDTPDTHKTAYSTIAVNSGKWYWEAKAIAGSLTKWTYGVSDVKNIGVGQISGQNALLAHDTNSGSTYVLGDAVSIYIDDIRKNGSVTGSDVQDDIAQGDIVAIALDVDAGKVWFARNGTWINGSATASTTLNPASHDTTVTTGETYVPAFSGESADWQVNFGQDDSFSGTSTSQGNQDENGLGSFYYAVPSGFKALCTKNLSPNVPSVVRPQKYFDTILYTGNGSTQSVSGLEFKPDFVWIKERSSGSEHKVFDVVRGVQKGLTTAGNGTEEDQASYLTKFHDHGFVVGNDGAVNENSQTYVSWCWKAGGTAVSNDDGSITSSVSANQTSGFSIITYTGTGSAATIGHGLGKAPKLIWVKNRTTQQDWFVNNGMILNDLGKYYKLNSSSSSNASDTNVFPNTAPTSTVFSVGGDNAVNGSGDNYLAYVWSEIPGFSQFGYWTGNGITNGAYIHTGFTPKLIIYRKESDTNWHMLDTERDSLNPNTAGLDPNLPNAEADDSNLAIDFLSSGFKLRTSHSTANGSGTKYFYYTWAGQSGVTPFATVANAR